MNHRNFLNRYLSCLYISAMLFASPQAQAQDADDNWHLTGELYLWGASISGTTRIGGDIDVGIDDLLDNLDFAMMGGLEARKGKWSLIGDVIYLDVSADKSGSLTDLGLATVTADVGVEGWVSNLLAGYNLANTETASADVVFGARYLDVDAKLNISVTSPVQTPGLDFSGGVDSWDGVVGLRGGIGLSKSFYIPYYVDVGTGQADFTWQAILGIGYQPKWGEITLAYRHIEWEFDSDSIINDISLSGPGISFRYNFF